MVESWSLFGSLTEVEPHRHIGNESKRDLGDVHGNACFALVRRLDDCRSNWNALVMQVLDGCIVNRRSSSHIRRHRHDRFPSSRLAAADCDIRQALFLVVVGERINEKDVSLQTILYPKSCQGVGCLSYALFIVHVES